MSEKVAARLLTAVAVIELCIPGMDSWQCFQSYMTITCLFSDLYGDNELDGLRIGEVIGLVQDAVQSMVRIFREEDPAKKVCVCAFRSFKILMQVL